MVFPELRYRRVTGCPRQLCHSDVFEETGG